MVPQYSLDDQVLPLTIFAFYFHNYYFSLIFLFHSYDGFKER